VKNTFNAHHPEELAAIQHDIKMNTIHGTLSVIYLGGAFLTQLLYTIIMCWLESYKALTADDCCYRYAFVNT